MTINKFLSISFSILCWVLQQHCHADEIHEAEQAYKEGNFGEASEKFLNAEIEDPDNLQHTYNRSVSQFMNKDYEGAASGFAKSAKSKDPTIARNSQFNLGNTKIAKGDLKGAQDVFTELLNQHPDDQATQENLAWVKKMIKELEKQKQNQDQQNQDQQNQDQQNQDQQNQDQQNQDQQNQDQQNQDQQNQDQQNQDQQNQDQQNQDQQNQDQQNQDQQNQDQQDQDQQKNNAEEENHEQHQGQENQSSQEQEQQAAKMREENLDKADAERLLRSLEDQERYYGKPPKIPNSNRKPIKDW